MGTAGFDREEDFWPRRWAEAYVAFAAGEKRGLAARKGMRCFPVVGWAERGGYGAMGHGNSVPRFHITWGTGPGVLEPFVRRARARPRPRPPDASSSAIASSPAIRTAARSTAFRGRSWSRRRWLAARAVRVTWSVSSR